MNFARLRERRRNAATRERYAETPKLGPENFILPLFVREIPGRREVPGLEGVYHLGMDELLREVEESLKLGLRRFLLFGVVPPQQKDACGSVAQNDAALIPRALRLLKQQFGTEYPDLRLITDICLCGYTDHGHCGVLRLDSEGTLQVANDETLPHYASMAVTHGRAGADLVAPSGMMDGQVAAIRQELDAAGLTNCQILAYSAKYASNFYGPFRQALGSEPKGENPELWHRKSYQMDFRNSDEALRAVEADLAEGAAQVMIKPAMNYLDIVQRVANLLRSHDSKLVLYHVSGEYMMWRSAVKAGVLDEWPSLHEMYVAWRRAGAVQIISYAAPAIFKK